ncbi:hypothetical protein GTW64_10735 [Streptomyces sp. SID4923]|nr:hypothetical protein [Streptomyces sp. SID4923]
MNDRCFLCGTDLSGGNRTDEHVFPQWLIKRCALHNQHITLLNGTTLPYRKLTIPCCSACNNEHLSRIEIQVRQAFDSGHEAVAALDPDVLFLWMGKVYYGLMFRELSLLADRRDASLGAIMPTEFLAGFSTHHMLLQAARGAVRWETNRHPASTFVFRAQEPSDPRNRFDYVDIVNFPFFAVRIADTAVVSVLQDWGALSKAVTVPNIEAAKQLILHPQQFREVSALAAYMSILFNRVPKHLMMAREDHVELFTLPIAGLSAKPVYDPFVVGDYAQVLSTITGQPLEELYDGEHVVTLLRGPDGNPYTVPWSADEHFFVHVGSAPESAPEG